MMMHPGGKMVTFMWCVLHGSVSGVLDDPAHLFHRVLHSGENIGCPLMLVCMSECSDMPLACVCVPTSCSPAYMRSLR